MAFRGQKLPRTRRIWMLDTSSSQHTPASGLFFFFFPRSNSICPSSRCGQSSEAGAEPGTAPAGPPRPEMLWSPGAFGARRCFAAALSSSEDSDPGAGREDTHTSSVGNGSVPAASLPGAPPFRPPHSGTAPPPYPRIPVAAGCHSHPGGCSGCW